MQQTTPMLRSLWGRLRQNPVLLSSLGTTLLIVGLRLLGGFQFLEWKLLDTMLRLRVAEPIDSRITIVAINEADLQEIGVYPIPDGQLAELIQTLQRHQPRAIGLDIFRDLPVEPGHQLLAETFASSPEIVGIERRILSSPVAAAPALPDEQVGFVDVVLDSDGFLRRDLLGATDREGNYRFSLTIQLAQLYLRHTENALENGLLDPEAMRFGPAELSRFRPNEGGYIRADAGGNQVLVLPRSGPQPFRTVSLQDIQADRVPADWFEDRIILVGITAPSIKDIVNSGAIQGVNPGLVSGVEFRAHALSQVLSAALDDRPLLRSWPDGGEYGWILLWGVMGWGLHYWSQSPRGQLLMASGGVMLLASFGYGLLLQGLWLPIVPAGLAFLLNSVLLYIFELYDQGLRDRIQERQQVIEQSFNAIHNGPLQSLVQLIRKAEGDAKLDPAQYKNDLKAINKELRQVYSVLRQQSSRLEGQLYLDSASSVDVNIPLHELLYEVYHNTLERDFPCFAGLRFHVTQFEPMAELGLSLETKQALARFLEEALCNCGKYATDATRLKVVCCRRDERNVIEVVDNGISADSAAEAHDGGGYGTEQALQISQQLGGTFERRTVEPKGILCRLSWTESLSLRQRLVCFLQDQWQKTETVDKT